MKLSVARSLLSLILLPSITVACGGGPVAKTVLPTPPVSAPPVPDPAPPPPPPDPPPTPTPAPPPPAPTPTVPTSWNLVDLPGLTGMNVTAANGINDSGHAVGYSIDSSDVPHATLWKDGQAIELGQGIAVAINNSDQVIGYVGADACFRNCSTGPTQPILWPDGIVLDIPAGFDFAIPAGINDQGIVVGTAKGTDPSGAPIQQAWRWDTVANSNQPITGCQIANAINFKGQIAGMSSNGNATICGLPDFGVAGNALALNSAATAVGFAAADAFLFPSTDLGPSSAVGINDLGWIVGNHDLPGSASVRPNVLKIARPNFFPTEPIQPWIWSSASGIELLPFMGPVSGINTSGQVIGTAISGGAGTAVMLTGK